MSVVGFDIGYQACHIAIARHGGVEMVANEYSDRRSPTMVAFGPKQRQMGTSARNQQVMNFKHTVYGFKTLLGRKFSDPYVQEEIKHLPFQVVQQGNDDIGIKVQHGGEDQVFTPEQITAMMLSYLKQVAEKALGKPVADCVISVPSCFTDSQRRAFLDASSIAGLNCLRLMNETTAAALAYGIYKQDLPAENEKPRNVAFVDMGHSTLEVAICAFQKGKLKVLSKAFDNSLGGRNFDRRIMEKFSAEFKKRHNIDSLTLPRQTLRLTYECERLKKSMGTITQPVRLSLECFANDKDLNGSIKRDEFNEMCKDLLDRVRTPLEDALAKSKLSLADIDSVELVGGSSRVPAVKEIIMSTYKRELSTTLNLDEAVSRGCALQCAMLSPTFKVRDFSITDIQPYPIMLRWQTIMEGEDGQMTVYKEGDPIYHSKMLTFYRKEPFDLEAVYEKPEQVPSPHIGVFSVKNVTPNDEGESSKVKVKVRLSIHGVFFVKSATMVEKQKAEEPEAMETEPTPQESQPPPPQPPSAPAEEATDQAQPEEPQPSEESAQQEEPSDGGEQPQQQEQEQQETQQEMNSDEMKNEPAASTESQSDDSPPMEKKTDGAMKPPDSKKPKKPSVKYVDLPIDSRTSSLSKQQLNRANEQEVNLRYQDQREIEKADARNAVEEYMYNMRDKLDYELKEFISEEDRTVFMTALNSMEEWLYEEGEDQPKKVYVDRLAELKKQGDPVQQRQYEFGERPKAFNEMGSVVVHYEKIVSKYESGDEEYNHLDKEEMDKVKQQVGNKREWLNTQMQLCQTLAKHVTPPVTCAQITAEMKNLETECKPIVTKPKPKVEPPKDEKKDENGTKEEPGEGSNSEGTKMEEDPKPAESEGSKEPAEEEMDVDLD